MHQKERMDKEMVTASSTNIPGFKPPVRLTQVLDDSLLDDLHDTPRFHPFEFASYDAQLISFAKADVAKGMNERLMIASTYTSKNAGLRTKLPLNSFSPFDADVSSTPRPYPTCLVVQ